MTDGEADEDGQSSERLREGFDILTKHMLLGRVDVLLEATSEFAFPVVSAAYGGRPAAGSPMNADLACESADIVANVQRVCGAWSMVASEYLQAVATAHQAGRILWAPGPLRGCLEHCARIGWILDGSDARQRGARSWLAEIVASGEDARTHENLGNPAPTLHGAPRRLEHLCTSVVPQLFGEEPVRTSRNPTQWTLCEERWGNYTTAVKVFFTNHVERWSGVVADGRVQYRIASMFTHPSTSALFSLADLSEPGSAEFIWDWNLTRARTVVALVSFYAASCSLYEYLGWHSDEFRAWALHLQNFIEQGEAAKAEGS